MEIEMITCEKKNLKPLKVKMKTSENKLRKNQTSNRSDLDNSKT